MQIDEAYALLNIVQDLIPAGSSNRPGTKLVPTGITIHNTDNSDKGANAAAHAKYQKGADARKRQVSWHFTVDDVSVYQSLPTNEVGWHAHNKTGNATTLGVEICMNADLDVKAAYDRAALLVAVLAFQNKIAVPKGIFQHHDWYPAKDCPTVLRNKPNGWSDFVGQIKTALSSLSPVLVATVSVDKKNKDHHLLD
ncbi:MAG TPA: peptidoglycan recognition family protein [Terracidiphilus sp.]|jgi:N-acetylmuramoyl-L-alanine amidase CwlA